VIYSGLDWSGSPGNTHGPWLVFAVVHITDTDLPTLDAEFGAAKQRLRVAPTFVFKHDEAADLVREQVFKALQRTPMEAHVHMLNKAAWRAAYGGKMKGNDCICGGIIKLVMACPDAVVAKQVLLIDPPSAKLVKELRTSISQSFRGAYRTGFRSVRPRRDDEPDGGIIQTADMIAGEVRRQGGVAGPFLSALTTKIHLV
jgi:hypothetical protein